MMVRGLRGATTVENDEEQLFLKQRKHLSKKWRKRTRVLPEDIISVLISTTTDIKSTFPAKAVRSIDGWMYVPVMCTHEMDVPGAMPLCIRVLMHVNTDIPQRYVKHIYQNNAIKLRPDLQK